METIDANAPLSVTLTAQQWNQLLSLLAEGPYRIAAPLISAITSQASASMRPDGAMAGDTVRANGEARP